jgi:hypothetical protein
MVIAKLQSDEIAAVVGNNSVLQILEAVSNLIACMHGKTPDRY